MNLLYTKKKNVTIIYLVRGDVYVVLSLFYENREVIFNRSSAQVKHIK